MVNNRDKYSGVGPPVKTMMCSIATIQLIDKVSTMYTTSVIRVNKPVTSDSEGP